MPRGRVPFDEEAFAEDCASGRYSQGQLAEKYGISRSLVNKIVCGRRRPDVREMIDAARQAARQRTKCRLTALLEKAVATIERSLDRPLDSVTLAAAREVLDRALGGSRRSRSLEPKPTAGTLARTGWAADTPSVLSELTPETRRRVMAELDGPDPDASGPEYAVPTPRAESPPPPAAPAPAAPRRANVTPSEGKHKRAAILSAYKAKRCGQR